MDPKYLINLNGKDYPLFQGVLNEAHEKGLQSIETQLIQIPDESNNNVAIVKAVVRMKDGSFFEDYGDASPRNCSARVATALIRLASTRAKGRAMRDAVNVGQTLLEELPDLSSASEDTLEWVCSNKHCGAVVTSTQAATTNLQYRRVLCETCVPKWIKHLEAKEAEERAA